MYLKIIINFLCFDMYNYVSLIVTFYLDQIYLSNCPLIIVAWEWLKCKNGYNLEIKVHKLIYLSGFLVIFTHNIRYISEI